MGRGGAPGDEGGQNGACSPDWAVGIVHHDAFDDLARCLEKISLQTRPPGRVMVFDTGRDEDRLAIVRRAFPDAHFESGPNLGYAGGANRILAQLATTHPAPSFVLLLNPDVELDAHFAEILLDAMVETPKVAIASGKLVRPDGTIDSAGVRLPLHRRPRDRGSEEPDRGQYDEIELVFAVTGAAMMLRRTAIDDIALGKEVFDEDFFLYHEDTDLCWRANRLGWCVLYHPAARALHRRRWRRDRRNEIEPWVRCHSFKNHYLQILKNESLPGFLGVFPVLLGWELMRFGFALLRDPSILRGYGAALRLAPRTWRKRRLLERKIRARKAGAF